MSENTTKEKAEETTSVTVETAEESVREPAQDIVGEPEQARESEKESGKELGKEPGKEPERARDAEKEEEAMIFAEEEPAKKKFFRFNKQEEEHFSRDKWILSRILSEDLMEYLRLEQSRMDRIQMAKERRWKRINTTIRLTASLAAGVTAVYFLKDEPTILVNILYICGILGGAWIWNNRKEKK